MGFECLERTKTDVTPGGTQGARRQHHPIKRTDGSRVGAHQPRWRWTAVSLADGDDAAAGGARARVSARPSRSHQALRDFPDLPRLPSGYFGMFLLAYLPPLWFGLTDPRVSRRYTATRHAPTFSPASANR
jgi:hypothetical protein